MSSWTLTPVYGLAMHLAGQAALQTLFWTVPKAKHSITQSPVSAALDLPYVAPDADTLDMNNALTAPGPPGVFFSSEIAEEQYGIYNWACMPHVRTREYERPSKEYELKYVEVIQRHHKRTPYASNILSKEDVEWDCQNEGPYHHARGHERTTPIYWQTDRSTNNPFERTVGEGFKGSTCTFPALTAQGVRDSIVHGRDFGAVYRDMLDFLPHGTERDKYEWRVTNNFLTSQTLSGFAAGLYPEEEEYSAKIQPASFDSLEPAFSCPFADRVKAAMEADPLWISHLTRSQNVRDRFNAVTGIDANAAGWKESWDHPFDNLAAKQSHGLPLPCSITDTQLCLSQADADRIYRLGNWEYAYRYRGSREALTYSVMKMGAWVTELRHNVDSVIRGSSVVKYRHNFAHDGSISALLGLLQVDEPYWPGMGAEIVMELWEKKKKWYTRILLSGKPLLSSSLGEVDMVKLETLLAYLDSVVPADLVSLCHS